MQNVGPQAQSGYTYQTIVNGVSPAMPANNNQTNAMPTGPVQSQQGHSQGYPLFAGHQTVHNHRSRGYSNMSGPNHSRSSTPIQSNVQLYQPVQDPQAQLAPQNQPTFAEQQVPDNKAEYLLQILAGNPKAMDGLVQFCSALAKQSSGQTHATSSAQTHQTIYPLHQPSVPPSPQTSSPGEAGHPSEADITNAGQPPLATEITQEFQQHVDSLVEQPATTFKSYIQSDADFALYEMAAWNAKRKDADIQNRSQGYPTDQLGKSQIKQRIFYAIQNMDGDQDPASDRGDFKDCVAVRTVQGLSDLETEILAHKIMEEMRKVQCGEPVIHLPAESKLVQEASFTDKVDQVVEALSVSGVPSTM